MPYALRPKNRLRQPVHSNFITAILLKTRHFCRNHVPEQGQKAVIQGQDQVLTVENLSNHSRVQDVSPRTIDTKERGQEVIFSVSCVVK